MLYDSENGNIRIALTGDSLITRPMSVYSERAFLGLVELLRGADVSITNAEMLFHNYENSPTIAPGGTYMQAHPRIIDELRWMGIDMVAAANNHSYDYGENGLLTNIRNLEAAGLPFAGIGSNLGEAREPTYLDTPAGRIALISATSSGPPGLLASHQWRDGWGRPGANMIRHTSEYAVTEDVFNALRKMRNELRLAELVRRGPSGEHKNHSWGLAAIPDTDDNFYLPSLQNTWQYPMPDGCRVALGDRFGVTLNAVRVDVEENLQRISDAKRSADWVIFSLHNHEQGATGDDPADFVVEFAHEAIDAGVVVFHGHGPHRDRGIEIYKGKPIFYSIGHFILENATVQRVALENFLRQGLHPWESTPADFSDRRYGDELEGTLSAMASESAMWRDAVAVVHFENRQLAKVVLHPIDLGFGRPRGQRGRPLLAGPEASEQVLELFQRLSKPFGTEISVQDDNIGVIHVTQ